MSQAEAEIRACPVCGATQRVFAVAAPGDYLDEEHPVPVATYPYYRCAECEAIYLGTLPSMETLSAYYEAPTYHVRHASLTGDRPDRVSPIWSAYLRIARPVPAGKPGRHLDYGCGPGDYVAFARSCGWESIGVEYSDRSAQEARSRGLEIILESELDRQAEGQFDFITLNQSLEHVPDPVATVAAMTRLLKPGGTMYIEFPNFDCLEYRIFGRNYSMISAPLHFQFYTPKTMQRIAEKTGLEVLRRKNNPWMMHYFMFSFLGFLRNEFGFAVSRHTSAVLCGLAFPVTAIPSLILPLFGFDGIGCRYFLTKR